MRKWIPFTIIMSCHHRICQRWRLHSQCPHHKEAKFMRLLQQLKPSWTCQWNQNMLAAMFPSAEPITTASTLISTRIPRSSFRRSVVREIICTCAKNQECISFKYRYWKSRWSYDQKAPLLVHLSPPSTRVIIGYLLRNWAKFLSYVFSEINLDIYIQHHVVQYCK